MNNNMMLMLLPLLMNKTGGGNAEMMKAILQAFSAGGKGNSSQNESFSMGGFLPLLMAMMTKKNQQSDVQGGKNEPADIGGIFGKDVWNVLRLFMEMNKKSV